MALASPRPTSVVGNPVPHAPAAHVQRQPDAAEKSPLCERTKKLRATHAFGLVTVACLAHGISLCCPFLMDDYVYVDRVRKLDGPGLLRMVVTPTLDEQASAAWWTPTGTLPFYRPVGELSFALDHLIWETRAFGYHLTNVILHVACTLLAWRLALRLLPVPPFAFAAAIIFALHPVHTEAVMWVSGRFDLLACLCLLASMLTYLQWAEGKRFLPLRFGLSVVLFAVALGCKETALLLPLMLLFLESVLGPDGRPRRVTAVVLGFGFPVIVYLLARFAIFGRPVGTIPPPYGLDVSTLESVLRGIFWNLAQYVLDFVLFLHIDPVYFAQFWRENPLLLLGALILVVLVVTATTMLAWREPAFRVGMFWLVVFAAPAMLAMPGERNVYTAGAGVALVIAAAVFQLNERSRARAADGADRQGAAFGVFTIRRASRLVVGLWLMLCVAEQSFMWLLSRGSNEVYRQIMALVPDPPTDARFYLANMSPLNSVGFGEALRLHYGRDDLTGFALSLSPTLRASTTDEVHPISPEVIRVQRTGGLLLDSFVERFHLFGQPASALPSLAQRAGLKLLRPPATLEQLATLDFQLPHSIGDPRIQVFLWDNSRVRSPADLFRLSSLTQVRPIKASVAGGSRAIGLAGYWAPPLAK